MHSGLGMQPAATASTPGPRDGGSTGWAYSLTTLPLVAGGSWLATRFGASGDEVWAGSLGAWVVQAASFARLIRALGARERALRPWVSGILARFGGLVVAVVASAATAAGVTLPLAYVATLLALLSVEVVWLARRPWPAPTRTVETKNEDERPG